MVYDRPYSIQINSFTRSLAGPQDFVVVRSGVIWLNATGILHHL